ncbi:MAG: glycosyltransferase [Ferruginibacter sp.]
MKKILVLSYYFAPCNLTPAERVYSFAKYFNDMGYYPVIVTRNWDIPINHARDEYKPTGNKIIHEKKDDFEVYYLPFRPGLKGRLFKKYYGTKYYFIYLFITFIYGIGENFSSAFTPFRSFYRHCNKLLSENNDIKLMLISGGPFHLFKFGYRLKKKYGIKWVADYRDDWNTNELVHINKFKILIQKISKYNELKWVKSAAFFISVSGHYVNKIHGLLKTVPGYTILNGYMNDNYENLHKQNVTGFTISYVGSLYPNQSIEIFLLAYKNFILNFPAVNSRVVFVGLAAQPHSMERVQKMVKGNEQNFEYTLRLPKREAIEMQYNSSVLLVCAYSNLKGIPGSKLYEYVALQKPVLVCPSDGEIIEETLTETGQGYFANTAEACYELLQKLYKEYGQEFSIAKNINAEAVQKYSRYNNVKKLAALLDAI